VNGRAKAGQIRSSSRRKSIDAPHAETSASGCDQIKHRLSVRYKLKLIGPDTHNFRADQLVHIVYMVTW